MSNAEPDVGGGMSRAYGGLVRFVITEMEGSAGFDIRWEGSVDGTSWAAVTPWVPVGDYQSVAICFTTRRPRSIGARVGAWADAEIAQLWRMLKR